MHKLNINNIPLFQSDKFEYILRQYATYKNKRLTNILQKKNQSRYKC